MRIVSTRRVESSLQSIVTWEQLSEIKKEHCHQSQAARGRIIRAWVNVQGGMRVFSVDVWHSQGRTPRNEALLEAVLKRATVTRHPWLVACDASMSPVEFEKKHLRSHNTVFPYNRLCPFRPSP